MVLPSSQKLFATWQKSCPRIPKRSNVCLCNSSRVRLVCPWVVSRASRRHWQSSERRWSLTKVLMTFCRRSWRASTTSSCPSTAASRLCDVNYRSPCVRVSTRSISLKILLKKKNRYERDNFKSHNPVDGLSLILLHSTAIDCLSPISPSWNCSFKLRAYVTLGKKKQEKEFPRPFHLVI